MSDPVLRKWLSQFGNIESTIWAKDKVTGKPYGTCFIEMETSQMAAAILGAQQSVLVRQPWFSGLGTTSLHGKHH